MAAPEEKHIRQADGGISVWSLATIFVAALGIVFAFSATGNAEVGPRSFYTSPPQSPVPSPLPSPAPTVDYISPSTGVVNSPHQINVYGDYFQDGAVVHIVWESHGLIARTADTGGHIELTTNFIGPGQLVAKVPANIAKGLYGVKVENPDTQYSQLLSSAYEAVSANPEESDDLYSRPGNLWTTPHALTAGESVSLGLTLFRAGGVGGLPPFAVDFYTDKIDTAHFIGRGFVAGISPDSNASTSAVAWTPTQHGEVELIAVIDPDGLIAESNENNNTIRRKVDVHFHQPADTTPPLAQKLFVNGGQQQIVDPNVDLSIEAVDPDPNPSGVSKSYYVELQWASGVGGGGAWIPVKWTSWKSYAAQPHPYELMPNSGLRYLQGWVADTAGNISAKPAIQRVNYVPATDTLLEGEIRIYRPATLAGQCLRVQVTPVGPAMDPDLYVWSPNHTPGSGPAGYSIQPAGETDEVILQPTEAGVYQVEIVGFTDATYTQSIEVLNNCPTGRDSVSDAPAASSDKLPRQEPSVPVEDVPQGNEAAPETIKQYLSFISVALQERSKSANSTIWLPTLVR